MSDLLQEMAALIERRSKEPCECDIYELRGDVDSCCTACEARAFIARLKVKGREAMAFVANSEAARAKKRGKR